MKNDITARITAITKPLSTEEKLMELVKDAAINTPQYWINALTGFKYFDLFVDAMYDKYSKLN